MQVAYTRGLHELGDGLFAYLQPDGGWGWSNAGLITAGGTSLLVDTLYDLRLTREMLEAMAPHTATHPIDAAVNTHGNPDHCYGNELLPAHTKIYSTVEAKKDLAAAPPQLLASLEHFSEDPAWAPFVAAAFGPFHFDDISLRLPTTTFEGNLELRVGDRQLSFIELGPAHTNGDAIVHVEDAGVVFTGDILFIEGTPIVWAGPVANWLRACDRIIELDATTLVPGHGPVTDNSGVRDVKRYLEYVQAQSRLCFEAGMDIETAADAIDISDFADWQDRERIVVNVAAVYRDLDPGSTPVPIPVHLERMARWRARH